MALQDDNLFSYLDTAFFYVETDTRPQNIAAAVRWTGTNPTESLKRKIPELLNTYSKANYHWGKLLITRKKYQSLDVDPESIVFPISLKSQSLSSFLSKEIMTPFQKDLPLWKVIVIEESNSSGFLFFKFHHSYADGVSGLQFLSELLHPPGKKATRPSAPLPPSRKYFSILKRGLSEIISQNGFRYTKQNNIIETRERHLGMLSFKRKDVNILKKKYSTTATNLLISIFAKAHFQLFPHTTLRLLIPVSTRPTNSKTKPGNYIGASSIVIPDLSGSLDKTITFLDQTLQQQYQSSSFYAYDLFAKYLSLLPFTISTRLAHFAAKKISAIFTSMIFPKTTITHEGTQFHEIYPYAALMPGQNLAIGCIRSAHSYDIGFLSDQIIGDSAQELQETFVAEFEKVLKSMGD